VHRDLKLANLLLGHNIEVKIGDFSLAAKLNFKGERRTSICGSAAYMAPEQHHPEIGHSYEVDIWALGVIMFHLLTGKSPFA
jgi:serine/threonine protein kinase